MTKEHGTLTSVHPAWIVSNTDPGAVGAHKVWRDTSVTPNVYRERNDADNAWDDLGSFSTGASPWLHVVFPFAFNHAGLDTGVVVPGWTPAADDVLYDGWLDVQTAWDGTTPTGDLLPPAQSNGFWGNTTAGLDMTHAATDPSAEGFTPSGGSARAGVTLQQLFAGANLYPPRVTPPGPLRVVVSRDGIPTVQALVGADVAPTSPLHVVAGVNDEFTYTPAATGVPETFTVAPGTYTGAAACIAAMAAALGGSAERFDTLVTVTNDGAGGILLTGKHGVTNNGDTITLGGNDVAAALGFTLNPDTFAGGMGGNPGATQGAAVLHLLVLRA